MIEIIAGKKGKGKTKIMLDKANSSIQDARGSIVYIDKNTGNMHELSNKVRLIDISQYPINDYSGFIGFICGILSQDYDIQEIYLDGFLTVSHVKDGQLSDAISEIGAISEKCGSRFILSISEDSENLPEDVRAKVTIGL